LCRLAWAAGVLLLGAPCVTRDVALRVRVFAGGPWGDAIYTLKRTLLRYFYQNHPEDSYEAPS